MTSLASIFRSSSGFKLIWMRPLLSVVFVPSMPMNDDRLSTAGSFRIALGQRLLPRRHGREGDVLRRVGNAQDHARVLHREKSLGRNRRRGTPSRPAWRWRPAASRTDGAERPSSVLP